MYYSPEVCFCSQTPVCVVLHRMSVFSKRLGHLVPVMLFSRRLCRTILVSFRFVSTLFQNLAGISPEFHRNFNRIHKNFTGSSPNSPEFRQNIELEHLKKGGQPPLGLPTPGPGHVYMCVYIYIYIYICIYIYITHIYTYTHTHAHTHTYTYT